MLKSRNELQQYLDNVRKRYIRNKKTTFELSMKAQERFEISSGDFTDMISGRVNLSDVSEYYLFCLTYMIDLREETLIHRDYFTEKEVDLYLKLKIKDEVNDIFPIVFDCTQTTRDQWIGSTTAGFLMKLRKLQLIRYNPETQRSMTKIVRGDKDFFKISIDKNAVENIARSYRDEEYIPDAITLNILPESNADFFYDEKKRQLIINSVEHLDMTDGFHRYQALGRVADENAMFDYPMELRITNFNEVKAKKYIWQQDQKTRMRRIDSNSMNMDNSAVIVLEGLNMDISSPLKGFFKRNGGQINIGELAHIIDYFYFSDVPKARHRAQIIIVKKNINDIFGRLFEYDPTYTEKRFSYMELLFIIRTFMKFENLETGEIVRIYNEAMSKVDMELKKRIAHMRIGKTVVKNIDELIEGVAYV